MGQAKFQPDAPEPEEEMLPADRPWGVRVIAGPDLGKSASFVGDVLRIGTAEGCRLRLTDPTVEPLHAELELASDGVVLRDRSDRPRRVREARPGDAPRVPDAPFSLRAPPSGTWVLDQRVGEVLLGSVRSFRVGDTHLELVRLPEDPSAG